jgi:hypothetical protein
MGQVDPVERFIEIAEEWVGTKEEPEGSNRGFHIDLWNRACNVPVGSFWCATFLSSVATRLKFLTGVNWQLGTSADCDVWFARAKKLGIVYQTPRKGDIFVVMAKGSLTDAVHIGIVGGFDKGEWWSIEGNSNLDGSRNGTAVVKRPDLFAFRTSTNLRFIRWAETIDIDKKLDWLVMMGEDIIPGKSINGRVYAPLRDLLKGLYGASVETRLDFDLVPLWDDKAIPCTPIIVDGRSQVSVREFAVWQMLNVVIPHQSGNVIHLQRS